MTLITLTPPDVVRGHEIWLENVKKSGSGGSAFACSLLFGHNMQIDGVADATNAKAVVIAPDTVKHDLVITALDTALTMVFQPTLSGEHLLAAEYDAGIYTITEAGWHKGPKKDFSNVKRSGHYYQYAKNIVAGIGGNMASHLVGHELEIVPVDWRQHYHVGDVVALQVLYEGAALSEGVVTVAAGGEGGNGVDLPIGWDGMVKFAFQRPGNWMFKVRHTDLSKGVENMFDEKVITAVFTVMNVH